MSVSVLPSQIPKRTEQNRTSLTLMLYISTDEVIHHIQRVTIIKDMFTCDKVKMKERAQYMSLVMRKPAFAYAKTKMQISFSVTAKLISAIVSTTSEISSL